MQFKNATDFSYVSAATPLPVTLSGTISPTIVDDTTTNATMYLVWVTAATGNLPLKVTSTKLTYNPSTGQLSSTGNFRINTAIDDKGYTMGTTAGVIRWVCRMTTTETGSGNVGSDWSLVRRADDGSDLGVCFLVSRSTGAPTVCAATATPANGSSSAMLAFGTTAGLGIYYGSGAPSVSAAQGSIYIRTDGSSSSTRLYVNSTGSTTWVNLTSAS